MAHPIGILFNDAIPGTDKKVADLVDQIQKARVPVFLTKEQARKTQKASLGVTRSELLKTIRLLIAVGGDGTTLRAARMTAPYEIPVLGIHVGGLGFLTELEIQDAKKSLKKIVSGSLHVDERSMLEGEVIRSGKTISRLIALNDIVISKSDIARMIRLEARVDGELINTYRADGLIISTPTGSSGHSLSAGGPLLTSDLGAVLMTAICPHSFSHRPIVISSKHADGLSPSIISVKLMKAPIGQNVLLTADGQETVALQDGDEILIRESSLKTRFARLTPYSLFETLRRKLKWGN